MKQSTKSNSVKTIFGDVSYINKDNWDEYLLEKHKEDFEDDIIIDEISKQFNITMQKAQDEYEKMKAKHPHIKKARKNLKKIENVPKYKPPGIGIDIQGIAC